MQGGGLAGHGQVQVDAVEQRAGELAAVAGDLLRGAAAAAAGIAKIAAGAGIHRRHQLEARREAHLVAGPGDNDLPAFQGLAQHLQHLAVELGQLVQEQHALMGQGDLAGLRTAAAADQGRPGGAVVGRAERPLGPGVQRRVTGHRLNGGDLQGLLLVQRRQQAGQAAGQQGLAGTGRAAEQQIVGAGGGNQQRALGGGLALHLGQVRIGSGLAQQAAGLVGRDGGLAAEVGGQLQQVFDGDHRQPRGQAGFLGIGLGHHQGAPGRAGRQGGRQHALDRSHGAGQGQFAEALQLFQRRAGHLAAGGKDTQGDGQVEAPAVLRQVGRGQVQGDASGREVEGRVEDGAAHPVLAFLDGRLRQADQRQGGQAVGQVRLDGDGGCLDADLGAAVDYGQGHRSLLDRLPRG